MVRRSMGLPLIKTSPRNLPSNLPDNTFKKVVLPLPEGPMMDNMEPGSAESEIRHHGAAYQHNHSNCLKCVTLSVPSSYSAPYNLMGKKFEGDINVLGGFVMSYWISFQTIWIGVELLKSMVARK